MVHLLVVKTYTGVAIERVHVALSACLIPLEDLPQVVAVLLGLWNVRAGLCATAILAPAEHRAVARGPAEHGQGVILHEGGQSELLVCVKWSEHCRGRGELPFY